jgi:hypothetical protein
MIIVAIKVSEASFGRIGLILIPNDESLASTIPNPSNVRLYDEEYWKGHFIAAFIDSETDVYFLRKDLRFYYISRLATQAN